MSEAGMNLRAFWKQTDERISEMSLRERGLLFVAIMVLLYMAASILVFSPLQREQLRIEQQIKDKQEQTRRLNDEVQKMSGQGGRAGMEARAVRIETLRGQLNNLDASLGQLTQGLVPPREMAKLVEQMLRGNRRLQLVKIESLPATALVEGEAQTAASGALYRHGMRVQFKGEYGDIVEYLRALERLPWRMFWGEISLNAKAYPVSTVTLVLYTLSTEQAWMGV